ncbi:MAG TPA: tetratricopeptide repeat protein, partial [Rubrivivax sp.]|nr:tetratricopeptide repeat protein [Rubrivivax sp.]
MCGAWALQGCARQDDAALGRELAAKGDHAGAAIALKSAVQAAPDSAELRILLADALQHRHDLPGAEQQLRHAIEHGGDANALTPRLALLMLDRGDADALVRSFKDQRLSDPRADAELRGTVALALLTQKRDAAAKAHLLGALPVAQVRLAQAQLLAGDGKADSARQALALLQLDDTAATAPWWLLRAGRRLALAAGEPELSLQLVRRAHEAVPYHLGLMGEYGEALMSAGRADEAAAVRDQLRKQAPQSYWTHYLDALLQYRAGHNEAAHAAALAVLKAAPDHAGSALIAAAIELRSGEPQTAEKRMEALLQKQPSSLPALRLLAQAQLRQGRGEPAGQTLQRALTLAPADAELLVLRAQSDLAAGRSKQAAAALAQVVAQHPGDADAWLLLARARAAAGDRAGAREALQQAAARAQDSAVGARVVELALQLQDIDWARAYATTLLQRAPKDALARLALGAVQSAQGDNEAARATALAVLDDAPTHPGALSVLALMSRSGAQRQELLARHAKALAVGGAGPQQLLDYAALLRFEPVAGTTPLAVLEKGVQLYPAAVALRAALVE